MKELHSKFEMLKLSAEDLQYISDILDRSSLSPSSARDCSMTAAALLPHASADLTLTEQLLYAVIDVKMFFQPQADQVVPPDFPSVETAEAMLVAELQVRERTVGSDSSVLLPTLQQLLNLYSVWHSISPQDTLARAEPLAHRMLSIARQHSDHECYISSNVGLFWSSLGRYDLATPLFERSLQLYQQAAPPGTGDNTEDIIRVLNMVATAYAAEGRYAEADEVYKRVFAACKQVYRDDPAKLASVTAFSQVNYGNLLHSLDRCREADDILQQALQGLLAEGDAAMPSVATCLCSWGAVCSRLGRYDQAEQLLEQCLQLRKQLLGDRHADIADCLNNLATVYEHQNRWVEAEILLEGTLEMYEELLGPRHPNVALSLTNLATLKRTMRDFDAAEPLMRRALDIHREVHGEEHVTVAHDQQWLGQLCLLQERYEDAERMLLESLRQFLDLFSEDSPHVAGCRSDLGLLYLHAKRLDEAETMMKLAWSSRSKRLGDDDPSTALSINNIGRLYEARGQHAEALAQYEAALRVLAARLPLDDLDVHGVRINIRRARAHLQTAAGQAAP